jgi:hypothetical protein
MNDFEFLKNKFANFKVFIKTISRRPQKLAYLSLLSDDDWLVLVYKDIVPHFKNNSMHNIVDEMIKYLDIDKTDVDNVTKLTRYLECFAEFLLSDDHKDVQEHAAQKAQQIDEMKTKMIDQIEAIKNSINNGTNSE